VPKSQEKPFAFIVRGLFVVSMIQPGGILGTGVISMVLIRWVKVSGEEDLKGSGKPFRSSEIGLR
jgi:hypothetical protein